MRLVKFTTVVRNEGWMNPEKVEAQVWVNPERVLTVWKLDNGGAAVRLAQGTILEVKETVDTVLSRLEERRPYVPGLWEE